MSLARRHRAFHEALAAAAARPDVEGGLTQLADAMAATQPAMPATGREHIQALARLTADRRRLKEIQSIEKKIEAKRDMLPEYTDYVIGVLSAAQASGTATPDEVIAHLMVWSVDVGALPAALSLAEHMVRYRLPMPAHFQRTTGTLVAEEFAEAAKKIFDAGGLPDLDVLFEVDDLVADEDMPDEVRAKLKKALGLALLGHASKPDEGSGLAGAQRAAQDRALAAFRRALELDPRVGVKKQIEQLEKTLKKADTAGAPSERSSDATPPAPTEPDAGPDGETPPPPAG